MKEGFKRNRMFYIILIGLLVVTSVLVVLGKLDLNHTILLVVLGFLQNTSFSMVSRSRNRDNMDYHAIASLFSNTLWLLVIQRLFKEDFSGVLLAPYALGTISGSVFGSKLSMKIERWLGASADGHLKEKK